MIVKYPIFIRAENIVAHGGLYIPPCRETAVAIVVEDKGFPYRLSVNNGSIVCECSEARYSMNSVWFCVHKLAYLLSIRYEKELSPDPTKPNDWMTVVDVLTYVIDPNVHRQMAKLSPEIKEPGLFSFQMKEDWLSPYRNIIMREAAWSIGFPYGVEIVCS